MNRSDNLFVYLTMMIVLGIGVPAASGQAPVITSHQDGDTVYYGAQVTLECSGGCPPLTWSGPGSFNPSTGSEVTWTAPTSGTTAMVTVTDGCSQSDSVTFNLTNIIFVDKDRAGDDGTTWIKAFKHLQDALAVAGPGCEIWVAEGTYRPDENKDSPTGTGNRYSYFHLISGVSIYGGFEGNETAREHRDWVVHPTIASGDLDEDGLDAQNSRHVVYAYNVTNAALDGFTITMGYGHATYDNTDGVGMWNYAYNGTCSPTVANCIFKGNRAEGDDADGAAMHNFNASPTVTNCIFIDNITGDDGGALCNKNGSNGTFTNCVFYSNETLGHNEDSQGGAIFNTKGEGGSYVGSTPTFLNCVIADNLTRVNSGGGDGGGAADQDTGTSVTWTNCTFHGNTAQDDGGGLATRDGATSTVKNCIFWADNAWDNGDELWHNTGTVTISYSDIEGCLPGGVWNAALGTNGGGNIDSDPQFYDAADPDGSDNRFLTTDDGLEIFLDSPCMDTGTNTGAPSGDATGRTRPLDGDENGTATVDMGAYEFEPIVRKEPYLIYPGQTATPNSTAQMTVLWQLKQTRTCTLEWGTTTSYGSSTQTTEYSSGSYGHQHKYTIPNLTPGTKHFYRIAGVGKGSFYTAPAATATSAKFLVYSDTQGTNGTPAANYDAVCAGMVDAFTNDSGFQTFALHAGDRTDRGGNSEAAWENEYFGRSQQNAMDLLANVPILGCMGNHELKDSGGTYRAQSYYTTPLFNKYWPYPFEGATDTSYWSFDYGPIHVAVVDQYADGTYSTSNGVGANQLAWLKDDLKDTDRGWKFVIFHETGYAGTGTSGTAYQEVRNILQPVFDMNDVDIVFCGHSHYYCHSAVDGVTHITTGGGGGSLSSYTAASWHVGPNPTSAGVKHHFCKVTINGTLDRLTLEAIDKDGDPIESFTIQH